MPIKSKSSIGQQCDGVRGSIPDHNAINSSAVGEFSPIADEADPIVFGKLASGSADLRNIIVGVDNRTRIAATQSFPWRCICNLEILSRDGRSFFATGWLAAPRLVVTAGHCVFHNEVLGGWAKSILIIAGRNGSVRPFGTMIGKRFSCPAPWRQDALANYDLGCIHLDEPLGESLGYFSITAKSANMLRGAVVNLAGYPGDKGGKHLYHDANAISEVGAQTVTYLADARPGQSGSPVWVQQHSRDHPQVVGIHSGAVPLDRARPQLNNAIKISNRIVNMLQEWKNYQQDE